MWGRIKRVLPIVGLAALGLAISVAIEVVHRRLAADAGYTSFCNVNAQINCDVVLGSAYATLGGVSVSTWAILYYVVLLVAAAGAGLAPGAQRRAQLAGVTFVLTLWGLLFSLYLAAVAFFMLHTVCLMCSSLYLVSIALFGAAWWLRGTLRVAGRRQIAARGVRDRLVLAGSVLAALALIAVGSWEALGHGVRDLDPAEIARRRPDFYRWYLAQPVVSVPSDDGHARGPAGAPITIVEFSDFACGHCAAFHESLAALWPRIADRVRLVFHHFPLDSTCNPSVPNQLHPEACLAAVAAECAAAQNKFWEYHDALFAHQQQLSRQFLISYAGHLGLDVGRFTACLGSEAPLRQVERDAKAGSTLGIDSTPTIFINGRTIKGALDTQALADALSLAREPAARR